MPVDDGVAAVLAAVLGAAGDSVAEDVEDVANALPELETVMLGMGTE